MSWNRKWDADEVVKAIQERALTGKGLNPKSVRDDNMGLYLAAFRYVGSWREALRLAGEPDACLRRIWTKENVVDEIHRRARSNLPLNPGAVQADDSGLWTAAINCFGRWDRALMAVGYDPVKCYKRPGSLHRRS